MSGKSLEYVRSFITYSHVDEIYRQHRVVDSSEDAKVQSEAPNPCQNRYHAPCTIAFELSLESQTFNLEIIINMKPESAFHMAGFIKQ